MNFSLVLCLLHVCICVRMYVCSVFLDLAKAFNTVNHDILPGKLQHYGIRGIANIFESYLKSRYQKVKIRKYSV